MNEKTWFLFLRISLGCGLTALTGPATELFRDPSSAANGFGKNCSYPPGAVNIKELNYSYYDFACRRVWSVGLISSMNSDGLIP